MVRAQYPHRPRIICTCQNTFYCPHVERVVEAQRARGAADVAFVSMAMEVYVDTEKEMGCGSHPYYTGAAKMV